MLMRLRAWWQRRRSARRAALMPERAIVVQCDDVGISVRSPDGQSQRIDWAAVEQVMIATNDTGPWGTDLWWVLSGATQRCLYPGGSTGEQEALAEFSRRFAHFRHDEVIRAMGCTSNAQFICWQR